MEQWIEESSINNSDDKGKSPVLLPQCDVYTCTKQPPHTCMTLYDIHMHSHNLPCISWCVHNKNKFAHTHAWCNTEFIKMVLN